MEDHVDGQEFNRILWQGLKGSQPYPEKPSEVDLRANRKQLLEALSSHFTTTNSSSC